jgi:hypothetical protein
MEDEMIEVNTLTDGYTLIAEAIKQMRPGVAVEPKVSEHVAAGVLVIDGHTISFKPSLRVLHDEYTNKTVLQKSNFKDEYQDVTEDDILQIAKTALSLADGEMARTSFASRIKAIYDQIAKALEAKGATVTRKLHGGIEGVDGQPAWYILKIDEIEERLGRYKSRKSGKLAIVVGDFGNKTRFPERKDGSFSYDVIADKLIAWANERNFHADAERTRKDNEKRIKDLASNLGVESYRWSGLSIDASTSTDHPVRLSIRYDNIVTIDNAEKLIAGLQALGLFVKK